MPRARGLRDLGPIAGQEGFTVGRLLGEVLNAERLEVQVSTRAFAQKDGDDGFAEAACFDLLPKFGDLGKRCRLGDLLFDDRRGLEKSVGRLLLVLLLGRRWWRLSLGWLRPDLGNSFLCWDRRWRWLGLGLLGR